MQPLQWLPAVGSLGSMTSKTVKMSAPPSPFLQCFFAKPSVATAIAGVFANFANKICKIIEKIRGCR